MLEIKKVSKSFELEKGRFDVLKDISLSAKEGEFVCVLGPTGCGKSVLLYLIAGFLAQTSGKILMGEAPVKKPGTDRAMVFQDYVLFPWKTVYGNVCFGLENSNLDKQRKRELVMRYLEMVGLAQFKDWPVHKLSGGMQQRVAFARALIINPKVLLMDEPFSALDAQYRKFLREQLVGIWEKTKKTIIFVTHGVNEAIYLADKIYLFTARPGTVKKVWNIDLPRPRDYRSADFIALSEEIEKEMAKEFDKSLVDQAANILPEYLLNSNL